MNITEVSLDELESSVPNLSIEQLDVPPDIVTPQTDETGFEDLDLLVDPSKSRQGSPVDNGEINNESGISNIEIKRSSPSSDNDQINFKMNVSRQSPTIPSFKSSSPTSFAPVRAPIGFRPKPIEDGAEKQELLFKLKRLESRGIPLSKHYCGSSSLEEMKDEYARIKHQRDVENSIKFQRKTMMAFASGVEFLNSKFDPFDVKLDGWSESLHENIDDYDEVFEELHEKYKTKAQIAPELKLLMMMGGSAVMFHMTNSLFKNSAPGVEDILKQNPDLARQFASAAVSSATQNSPGLGGVLDDMLNQTAPKHTQFMPPPQPSFTPQEVVSSPNDQDVENILNQINEFNNDAPPMMPVSPQPVKDISVPQGSDVPKKRRGRPRKERPETKSFSLNI